jgi:xanthine dehydrogenase accessory factor
MKKQLATWKLIQQSLDHETSVMLLYVLESFGSSPGRKGFFMAVNRKGKMEGSIGGGIMEHKFVEMAKQILKDNEKKSLVKKQVHDKTAGTNKSGMICSGEQTILAYTVKNEEKKTIKNIINALKNNQNGVLKMSSQGLQFSTSTFLNEPDSYIYTSDDEWLYVENIGYKNHLYIIGGGHCALAFSKLMSSLNFYIHLFDDRKKLNTMKKNKTAHEKKHIKNYSLLENLISSGENNYVVIMTFGYRTDDEALRALMNKKLKYLGVMGSKKKIEKMFETYKKEGISEDILQKIHAPVGINIHSQTTEEIAVSIAAEIIKVKNQPVA